eukprot:TRINITY_DN1241_c0_g1_i1.p1 TRINITY_DN1241_c0_g1~~TRINITY_DN1241_c0_g1_i1.p1  ORF type:complete len:504 (+),score=170.92 TRINITY_DN1241_c0_g1_i1:49-1560(+)
MCRTEHVAPARVAAYEPKWWHGIAGMNRGGAMNPPTWVDMDKAPGYTTQPHVAPEKMGVGHIATVLKGTFNPVGFAYSPNLVWLAIAAVAYVQCPMELDSEGARTLSWEYCLKRIQLHYAITISFYGFWTVAINVLGLASRPFPSQTEQGPPLSRFIHNVWYSMWGAAQASIWDLLCAYVFANGRVPYATDAEAFAPGVTGAITVLMILAVGELRNAHFFFAHVMIHLNFLYKWVHSLHHRNVSLDVWSGLCMHPVEHVYYYGGCGIVMFLGSFLGLSPFVVFWINIHTTLAAAAGHSGMEGAWQSEQFHTLHHAKFECNYGGSNVLDLVFGTCREKFGESQLYQGAWQEADTAADRNAEAKEQAKRIAERPFLRGGATLRGALWATQYNAVFDMACVAGLWTYFYCAMFAPEQIDLHGTFPIEVADGVSISAAAGVAALMAWFPPALGLLLIVIADKKSWRWPFHQWSAVRFVPFFLLANTAAALPVAVMAKYALDVAIAAH